MSWICIRIYIVPTSGGSRVTPDDAHRFIDQIRTDSLYGTYGKLDGDYWRERMSLDVEDLSQIELVDGPHSEPSGLVGYEMELRLNSSLFPPGMGGACHLFGMLAGDLLRFTLPPISLERWKVKAITFPEDWEVEEFNAFRGLNRANDVASIRAAFKLGPGMPLLAFSFKPRVGFDLKSLEDTALQVLLAGFNIVELDTRHLPLDRSMMMRLIELSARLPDKLQKHVGRLSINLSMRSDLAMEAAEMLCNVCPYPTVFKVDGGFNGLASVQSMRGRGLRDGRKCGPIITCYPLMQNALSQYFPGDQYLMRLAASGVDIVYPGGRPDVGRMVRSLEGAGEGNQVASVRRYRGLSQKGWPMLSIAGGIYPGQLQAFYELLGPNVAWFLGGGVALHKDGPRAGAELCVRIARDAVQKKMKAGKEWSEDISESLSEQADAMFQDRTLLSSDQLRYVSPRKHLSKVHGLDPCGY